MQPSIWNRRFSNLTSLLLLLLMTIMTAGLFYLSTKAQATADKWLADADEASLTITVVRHR